MDLRSFNVRIALLFFHWCLWKACISAKKKKDSNEFYNSYFFLLNYCTKTFEGYEILLHRSILTFLTNLKNAIQEHLLCKKKINTRKGYLFHWNRTMDATFH